MNLIGQTYFHDLTYVPALTGTYGGTGAAAQTERIAKLARHIAQYEVEFLTFVLGEDISTEFQAWIDSEDTTAKWVALKGKLLNTVRLTSPIANYIFCPYWKSTCLPVSMVGTTKGEPAESYRVRNVEVWNDMVRQNDKLFDWLSENRSTYEHDDFTLGLYKDWVMLTTTDNEFGL